MKLGQHSPGDTGAGLPSGQIFKSAVQGTFSQLAHGLHAFNDGQHSPTGIGAGVPSGQIFKSAVQRTFSQLVHGLHAFNDWQHSPTGTGAGVPSGQIFMSIVQKTTRQSSVGPIETHVRIVIRRIYRRNLRKVAP